MANRQRIVLLLLAVAVAVAAVVVIGAGGDDEGDVIDTRTETTAAQTTPATTTDAEPAPKPKPPKPRIPEIVVRDGEPVGGVEKLRFRKGGDIVFVVRSDVAAHVHLHGYDVLEDVPAGGRVRFDVPADVDGAFELELEDTATLIAEVEVVP